MKETTVLLILLLSIYLSCLLLYVWKSNPKKALQNSQHYLFGNGFGFILSFLGISATLFSTFTLQGMPAFFKNHGIASWVFLGVTDVCLAALLLFFGLKMRQFAQHLQQTNQTNTPKNLTEWLKQSGLSRPVIFFFVTSITLFLIPYITIQIKGAATLLQAAIPLSETHLLWSIIIVVWMLGYSWFGGIRAIFVTDAIQGIILLITVWAIAFFAIQAAGGISDLFATVARIEPALLSAPGPKGLLNWQFLLISFISIVLMPYVQPQLATRVLVAKDDKSFALSTVALGIFAILVVLPTLFIGLRSVAIGGDSNFMIRLLQSDVPAFFYALFIVGVLAAAMSTADSQLLAIGTEWGSAVTKGNIQDRQNARLLVKSIGVIVALISLILAQSSFKSLILFSINAFIGTSLLLPIIISAIIISSVYRQLLVSTSVISVIIFLLTILDILPRTYAGFRIELFLYVAIFLLILVAYKNHRNLSNTAYYHVKRTRT
ncbi:MAG: sodium:solute symporter family protein [Ostreibacterium sp.]